MKTFSEYQNRRIIDSTTGEIADGDYIKEDLIIRTEKGLLNDVVDPEGNLLPAIQFHDGSHFEHWQKGVLHFDNGPAVIDHTDNREEWWIHGEKIKSKE